MQLARFYCVSENKVKAQQEQSSLLFQGWQILYKLETTREGWKANIKTEHIITFKKFLIGKVMIKEILQQKLSVF